MHIDIPQRLMLELAMMTPAEQRAWLLKCGPADALLIDAAFEAWHANGQLEPDDAGWRVWLMMAGRGFGKTRAGAEWIHRLAMIRPVRIALVGASIAEARLVMVEGVSGILSVARRKRHRLKWEPSIGRLTWPRGSVAQLFSGDHADSLRGPEHHFAWCDELDVLVAGAVEGLPLATPPASPAIGDCYIVAGSPTGAWAGQAQQIAAYTSAGWRFIAPRDGMSLYVASSGEAAVYHDGAWEVGPLKGSELVVDGLKVVGSRGSAINAPAGGATIDAEARTALGMVLTAMREHGLIEM